jgi:hypothetical protein
VWGRMARILSSTHTKDHPKKYIDDNTILLKKRELKKRKRKKDVEKKRK